MPNLAADDALQGASEDPCRFDFNCPAHAPIIHRPESGPGLEASTGTRSPTDGWQDLGQQGANRVKICKVLVLAAALAAAVSGCKGLSGPSWLRPGPTEYQRRAAERFDPYPDQNIAPEVVGGRPREFQQPVAEPERARWSVPGVRP